jgi:hypothetical protein
MEMPSRVGMLRKYFTGSIANTVFRFLKKYKAWYGNTHNSATSWVETANATFTNAIHLDDNNRSGAKNRYGDGRTQTGSGLAAGAAGDALRDECEKWGGRPEIYRTPADSYHFSLDRSQPYGDDYRFSPCPAPLRDRLEPTANGVVISLSIMSLKWLAA